jgi:hypothetical protein
LGHVVAAGLVTAFAPLVLLIANRDWFFTPEGFLDPWQYVGFFRFYEDLDYSPEDYKVARLPWILAGYGVTRSMPTMPAAYLLHAIFLCALPLTFFGAAYTLLRRPALAAVLALCLGFYTHTHGSGGWDYHNAAAGPLYLATLWVAVLPSSLGGNPSALVLSGVVAALTAHTNITLVNLFPFLIYLHLVASRVETGRWPGSHILFARIGWALIGVLLATLILGAINWMVGRDFLFFARLLDLIARSTMGSPSIAGRPLSDTTWVLTSKHLALLAAILIAAILALAFEKHGAREEGQRLRYALIIQFLGASTLWIAWQALGQTALDWDYFAYALIPGAFLALAGLLSREWPEAVERRWAPATVATGLALAISLIATLPGLGSIGVFIAPAIVLVGCVVFLVPLAVYFWRPSVAAACLFVAVFAVGNRLVANAPENYAADDPCKVQPAVYRAIVEAASQLVSIDPVYRRVRIWFGENEMINPLPGCPVRLGWMGYSIRTMTSMNYVARPFPMPDVEDVPEQAIRQMKDSGAILTIVSGEPESQREWEQRLAALGLSYQEMHRFRVPVMEAEFTVRAWAVTPAP